MAKETNAGKLLVAMRNKKLTPEQRKEIAQKAARARWGVKKAGKGK
jgi:hypothetical protein